MSKTYEGLKAQAEALFSGEIREPYWTQEAEAIKKQVRKYKELGWIEPEEASQIVRMITEAEYE